MEKPVLPPYCKPKCDIGCRCQVLRNDPTVYNINRHLWELGMHTMTYPSLTFRVVTAEEYKSGKCFKCEEKATYLSYFSGQEKLLCDSHAAVCNKKNEGLPKDMWFCKPIN